MRTFLLALLLSCSLAVSGQNSSSSASSSSNPASSSQTKDSSSQATSKSDQLSAPNPAPPQSDHVDVSALDNEPGESSSKDTEIDLSPPADDAKTHPKSAEAVTEAESPAAGGEVGEFHPWNPHKAAKDVEVGDFYFKKKNYAGAESRYREALLDKDNDAIATFRLAVCLEKMDRPDEARQEYESYLKILPYGPQAEDAKKAIARLTNPAAEGKPAK
ncbi:MAG: tetratricopeptide repeat protein [Candidatus Sulfotelmatobacter sp.]|jgi:tetratricopeptide (TPR) repeat protein